MKHYSKALKVAAISALLLSGCGPNGLLSDEEVHAQVSQYDLNLYPMTKTVCDPFGGGGAQNPTQGLKASLFYLPVNSAPLSSAQDYIDQAVRSSQTLFFSDLNVPTRMFTEGFATQSSQTVKDDAGNLLIENFGLKFETTLRLRPDQEEGEYEIATLADDGAIVKAKINNQWVTIIQNDGVHMTRMGCGISTLHMSRDSGIPLEITYYQGPRYHIAKVLMWRKANGSSEGECGKEGNYYFFNPDEDSLAQQPYLGLLSRGWEPISTDNFFVPAASSYNPCVQGTAPVISGLRLLEVMSNDAVLSWSTDIPASSQLLVTNLATGAQFVTESNNLLSTSHRVQVGGLEAGTEYKVQALSISADLGKTLSSELTFMTNF